MKKILCSMFGALVLLVFMFNAFHVQTAMSAEVSEQQPINKTMNETEISNEIGTTNTPTATVDVWFHSDVGGGRNVVAAAIADFNAAHSNISVTLKVLPQGEYNELVQQAAQSGTLPCLLDFDGPYLYNYTYMGYLHPLDQYVSDTMKADFLPSIIRQGTFAGELYSLGQFDSGLAIWGNKAYLQAAGVRIPTSVADAWDKDEFLDALVKLETLSAVTYPLDLKLNYGKGEWYTYGLAPIMQSFGGDLINRNNYQTAQDVLNGHEAIEGMTFFQDLITDGYVAPASAGDDCFYNTKTCALAWVGHWQYQTHKNALGDDLVLIPMPKLGNEAVTGMGSWNWGITASCSHPDETWELLEFLLSPTQILSMTNANGAIPARQSALSQSSLYASDGELHIFKEQLESIALERPRTPAYPTITDAFAEVVENIANGANVETELDQAVTTIDQNIQNNNGYPMSRDIPTTGGSIFSISGDTQVVFPNSAFTHTVIVTYQHVLSSQHTSVLTDKLEVGHTFDLTAVYTDTGKVAQLAAGKTFTVTVNYTDTERGVVDESTLALYYWNGSEWEKETSSVVNTMSNVVTATPNHFSLWAVLGETRSVFLPIVLRN